MGIDVVPTLEWLRKGTTPRSAPPDAPPSFDGAGLEILYVIRVLVDQVFRPDAAIERPVAIPPAATTGTVTRSSTAAGSRMTVQGPEATSRGWREAGWR